MCYARVVKVESPVLQRAGVRVGDRVVLLLNDYPEKYQYHGVVLREGAEQPLYFYADELVMEDKYGGV